MQVGSGFCFQLFHPIAKEFQREKLSVSHQPVDDFLRSQWQKHTRAFWWLIYRWGLAICFCTGVIGVLVVQEQGAKWLLYITDWGFLLCMLTSVIGAILVSIYQLRPHYFDNCSGWLGIYWVLHWTTLVVATLVTSIYWIFLYPKDSTSPTALYNLWTHAFNSILMILDHMLVAFPTRLLHFVYPFCLLLIYVLFTIIYFFSGGVNGFGSTAIYPFLDWSEPGWTVITVFVCIVISLCWCFILFGLYKLRCLIYRKTNHNHVNI